MIKIGTNTTTLKNKRKLLQADDEHLPQQLLF
jgi:hypothetical protein